MTKHDGALDPEDFTTPDLTEDVEDAREREITPMAAPRWRKGRLRWLSVTALAALSLVAFGLAWQLGSRIPQDGAAAPIEARISALVSLGATTGAAAVSLAVVVLTLNLQREQEARRRWADFQASVLREAFDWISDVYSNVGNVASAINVLGYAVDDARAERLRHATQALQQFYDHGQQLKAVDRLELLVADRSVRRALRHADGALRSFNELVARR